MQNQSAHAIILNGTSSSGKTTIANGFLVQSDTPYTFLSLDNHIHALIKAYGERYPELNDADGNFAPGIFEILLPNFIFTFHDTIKAYLEAGKKIIVDHVLQESAWRDDLLLKIEPYNISIVGVYCSLEEIEKREKQRGDRQIGMARYQFERVHENMDYVIKIETDKMSIEESVAKIWELTGNKLDQVLR